MKHKGENKQGEKPVENICNVSREKCLKNGQCECAVIRRNGRTIELGCILYPETITINSCIRS